MAHTTILSLPTELLERIYTYLDWDRSETLYIHRPNLFSISLTCRQLRQSIVPLLFQNVILKLRWVDGTLIEPALYRLRKDQPHLAKHVRSVYIQTEFGQYVDPEFTIPGFQVPEGLADWVNPAAIADDPSRPVELLHRKRVDTIAQALFDKYKNANIPSHDREGTELRERLDNFYNSIIGEKLSLSARYSSEHNFMDILRNDAARPESTWTSREQCIKIKLQLDALVVVMLCFPANVSSLTFSAHARGRLDLLRNVFALHVIATALDIFGDRLHRFTMITSPSQNPSQSRLDVRNGYTDNNILTPELLQRMEKMTTLVISDDAGVEQQQYRELTMDGQIKWHALAPILTRLELWNFTSDSDELMRFIQGFEQLQRMAFENISLTEPHNQMRLQRPRHGDRKIWLTFLIELRRLKPELEIRLGRLKMHRPQQLLPPSAVQWLGKEAVPAGFTVGFDRETRLTEDFEYFLELWAAEDSERGDQAKESRKDGRLVDAAMTSRWKNFANLR